MAALVHQAFSNSNSTTASVEGCCDASPCCYVQRCYAFARLQHASRKPLDQRATTAPTATIPAAAPAPAAHLIFVWCPAAPFLEAEAEAEAKTAADITVGVEIGVTAGLEVAYSL